ncbi:hypothetical protein HK100_005057 [Physocladia obscura]|uniref:BZIP domain-containing protein n=1 Tax=Physocladia obscura TaxID=109957 RepID=A0AAD5SS57_9FUNG|nr:hypothetical protein HK100_005057 [Physocladia obscura]
MNSLPLLPTTTTTAQNSGRKRRSKETEAAGSEKRRSVSITNNDGEDNEQLARIRARNLEAQRTFQQKKAAKMTALENEVAALRAIVARTELPATVNNSPATVNSATAILAASNDSDALRRQIVVLGAENALLRATGVAVDLSSAKISTSNLPNQSNHHLSASSGLNSECSTCALEKLKSLVIMGLVKSLEAKITALQFENQTLRLASSSSFDFASSMFDSSVPIQNFQNNNTVTNSTTASVTTGVTIPPFSDIDGLSSFENLPSLANVISQQKHSVNLINSDGSEWQQNEHANEWRQSEEQNSQWHPQSSANDWHKIVSAQQQQLYPSSTTNNPLQQHHAISQNNPHNPSQTPTAFSANSPSSVSTPASQSAFSQPQQQQQQFLSATQLYGPPEVEFCRIAMKSIPSLTNCRYVDDLFNVFVLQSACTDRAKIQIYGLKCMSLRGRILDSCTLMDRQKVLELILFRNSMFDAEHIETGRTSAQVTQIPDEAKRYRDTLTAIKSLNADPVALALIDELCILNWSPNVKGRGKEKLMKIFAIGKRLEKTCGSVEDRTRYQLATEMFREGNKKRMDELYAEVDAEELPYLV